MRTRWSKASLSTQLARQRHSLHKLLGIVLFLQGSHYFWDSGQPQLRIPSFQVCLLRSRSFCTGPSALIAPFHKGFSSRCISELAVRFGPSVPIRPAQLWSKLCNCQHCILDSLFCAVPLNATLLLRFRVFQPDLWRWSQAKSDRRVPRSEVLRGVGADEKSLLVLYYLDLSCTVTFEVFWAVLVWVYHGLS